jgi:ribosomal protein L37AE/L43A
MDTHLLDEDDEHTAVCVHCSNNYPSRRLAAGYKVCMDCGDKAATQARKSWTVAPMHKSNYTLITDRKDLIGLNNKGGLVRGPTDN